MTQSATLTDEHKEALAQGREEGRTVRRYLDALDAHAPKRGRKRTPESVRKQMAETIEKLSNGVSPMERLELAQRRLDLEAEIAALESTDNMAELQAAFIKVAAAYSERKGITRAAWREVGVPPAVLNEAGIR